MTERIIDAKEALVGRLATVVAKAALLGDTIKIIPSLAIADFKVVKA